MKQPVDPEEHIGLEEARKQIGRRELLICAVAAGGGVVLLTSDSDSKNPLRQAEAQLAEIASTIDSTDLVDPQQSGPLRTNIKNTVELVNEELNQATSGNQDTEQRMSALRTAIKYYTELEAALGTAVDLQTSLEDSEVNVLYYNASLGYEPAARFDTAAFKKSIAQLSDDQPDTNTASDQLRNLLPDQSNVTDSLHEQRRVYQFHKTAQQVYLDTGDEIKAGVRAHEQYRYENARSKLTGARELLSTEIPTSKRRYRLSSDRLSLEQYVTLFTLRREGVTKLLEVADASLSAERRQASADGALDRFFQARKVVTS